MKEGWDSLPLLRSLQSQEASVYTAEKDTCQNPQMEALKQKNKHSCNKYKFWVIKTTVCMYDGNSIWVKSLVRLIISITIWYNYHQKTKFYMFYTAQHIRPRNSIIRSVPNFGKLSLLHNLIDCPTATIYKHFSNTLLFNGTMTVSYTHLTLPTNREV